MADLQEAQRSVYMLRVQALGFVCNPAFPVYCCMIGKVCQVLQNTNGNLLKRKSMGQQQQIAGTRTITESTPALKSVVAMAIGLALAMSLAGE